ncbi:hypothetical protein JCM10450v2_008185 [Rhodotorula kratochvilovae]
MQDSPRSVLATRGRHSPSSRHQTQAVPKVWRRSRESCTWFAFHAQVPTTSTFTLLLTLWTGGLDVYITPKTVRVDDKALAERDDNARRALLSEEDQIRELQDDILALSDDAVIADEFLSETADLIMALEDSALDAAREIEDRQQQQQPTSDAHASAKRVFDALSTASRRAQETDAEGRRFLAGYAARHYAELMRQLNPNANPSPLEEIWVALKSPRLRGHACQLSACVDQLDSNLARLKKAQKDGDRATSSAIARQEDEILALQEFLVSEGGAATEADALLGEVGDLLVALKRSAIEAWGDAPAAGEVLLHEGHELNGQAHQAAERLHQALSSAYAQAERTDTQGRHFLAAWAAQRYPDLNPFLLAAAANAAAPTAASYLYQEHRAPHLDEDTLGKGRAREGGFRRALVYFGRGY